MPNHVTNTTCTASRADGASPASLPPTHLRSAASTRPAPPRSTSHASSLVTPAGWPAGGTTTLSPPRVYKLEDGQIVRSLPAPSPGALAAGIRERLGRAVTARRPATALRQTTSAEDIRDTVRAVLCVGTAPPRGPTDGCASGSSVSEPAPGEPSPLARAAAGVLAGWNAAGGVRGAPASAAAEGVGAGAAAARADGGAASGLAAAAGADAATQGRPGRAQPEQRGLKRRRGEGDAALHPGVAGAADLGGARVLLTLEPD